MRGKFDRYCVYNTNYYKHNYLKNSSRMDKIYCRRFGWNQLNKIRYCEWYADIILRVIRENQR